MNSKEARTRARALGTPVGEHLSRVLRRHESVGAWTDEHALASLGYGTAHDVDDLATARQCLSTCVIEDADCGHCPPGTPWPCPDARDALRLLRKLVA